MKHTAQLVVWLAAAMLTACATTPPPADLSKYHSISIQLDSTSAHDAQDIQNLQSILVEKLKKDTPFETVKLSGGDTPADLHIVAEVALVRRVSNAQRISLGRSAGSNTISAWYTLVDGTSGKELARFKLIAYSPQRTAISPDWPWGDMETAMQRMGKQLAGKLATWYNHE